MPSDIVIILINFINVVLVKAFQPLFRLRKLPHALPEPVPRTQRQQVVYIPSGPSLLSYVR